MPRRVELLPACVADGYRVLPRRVGFLPVVCRGSGSVQDGCAVVLHTKTYIYRALRTVLYIGDLLKAFRSILDLNYIWKHLCPPLLPS